MSIVLATPANMERYNEPMVVAFSPDTWEEYSATPGDYWHAPSDEPLKDENGNPMVLARRTTNFEAIRENEPSSHEVLVDAISLALIHIDAGNPKGLYGYSYQELASLIATSIEKD